MKRREQLQPNDERELIVAARQYIHGKFSAEEFEKIERKYQSGYTGAARHLELRQSALGRIRRRLHGGLAKT